MQLFGPANPLIFTMGRIDDSNPNQPIWVFPYTQAAFRFTGTTLSIKLVNHWNYGESYLGAVIDGIQYRIRITSNEIPLELTIADHLPNIEHEAIVYKRQDGEHYLQIFGFLIDDDAQIMSPAKSTSHRCIEVYGDSVSAGERNEAARYVGASDPDVDLSSYSNAWYAYPAITARNLNAQLHDVAQGGAALLDGIGWFNGPDYLGMESIWDRIQYNPALGITKSWDFSRYTPQVVIVALGQNDSHPIDFMAQDYDSAKSVSWRDRYVYFIRQLRSKYPQALIICTSTVLRHDSNWDRAIAAACQDIHDPLIKHFLYSRNGSATPGHPRIAEHTEMANELTRFIEHFGTAIWDNQ